MSASEEAFCQKFRGFVLLCGICGIYIPGVDTIIPFLRKQPVFFCYTFVFFLANLSSGVDWLVLVINSKKELGSLMTFHVSIAVGLYFWSSINILYIILHRKRMSNILTYWNDQLNPDLWPETKENAVKEEYRKALKQASVIFLCVAGPYILHGPYKTAIGELYLPSNFGYGVTVRSGKMVAGFQAWSVACCTTGIALHHCWFSLLLRFAIIELTYLKNTMEKVINYPDVDIDGNIRIDPVKFENTQAYTYKNICNITKERLKLIIKYHVRCIKFLHLIKALFGSLVAFEFFFLTTCLCGLAYGASSGALPQDLAFYSLLMLGVLCYINMLNCQLGDEAMRLGQAVGMVCFHGNWMAYPMEVQKMVLIIISIASQKLLTINIFGMLHLTLSTFHKMTLLQYKFYRFMAETVKR